MSNETIMAPAELLNEPVAPGRWKVAAAFLAVYLIWGSTYLAIRVAIESMPPFLMAGCRFLIAGSALYFWSRSQGAARPTLAHWRSTAVIGALLLLGGNGCVVWAEQHVPSGLTALLVATVPLWMVLFEWLRPGGTSPRGGVIIGLIAGMAGVALLVAPGNLGGAERMDPFGAGALLFASISWSIGSLYSRHTTLPASPLLGTAMEMLAGGALLSLLGLVSGETGRVHPEAISTRSVAAFFYLIVLGSLVAFSCYVWILRVSTPARVATYAYVNPVVAVFLGWLILSEPITVRTLAAAAVIVISVVMITTFRTNPRRASE